MSNLHTLRRGCRRFALSDISSTTSIVSIVQYKAAATSSVTLTSNVTAGNLIVVAWGSYTGTPRGVTDNRGTTYALIKASVAGGGTLMYLYAGKPTSSGSCTITGSASGNTFNIAALEASGLAGTTGTTNAAAGTSSAAPSMSITGTGLLVMGIEGFSNSSTVTSSTPNLLTYINGNDMVGISAQYYPTSTAVTATYAGASPGFGLITAAFFT